MHFHPLSPVNDLPDCTATVEVPRFAGVGLAGFVFTHPQMATVKRIRVVASGMVLVDVSRSQDPETGEWLSIADKLALFAPVADRCALRLPLGELGQAVDTGAAGGVRCEVEIPAFARPYTLRAFAELTKAP